MDAQHEDPGQTAIPSGQYEVTVTWSARFSGPASVTAGAGLRGRADSRGNTTADTEGCPLLGAQQDANGRCGLCTEVNARLLRMLQGAIPLQKVMIEAHGTHESQNHRSVPSRVRRHHRILLRAVADAVGRTRQAQTFS